MESTERLADGRAAIAEAQAAQQRGDAATAANLYRRVLAESPDAWKLVVMATDGLKECGHWTEAVAALEKSLALKPNSAMLLGRLEKAYVEFKDYGRAAEYLRRYLEYDPRDPRLWRELGDLYTYARDFEQAAYAFSQVLTTEPLHVDAILGRGDACVELRRFDDALADYQRANVIQPNDPKILFRLGSLSLRYGAPKEAATFFQRLLQLDPKNVAGYANFSLSLSALGQYDDALAVAETALQVDARSAHAGFALGSALLGLERFDEAAQVLRDASDAVPRHVDILLTLADAEIARDNPFAAELALQQILNVDPADTAARFMIAAIHGEAVDAPPPDFAVKTFDSVASRYERQIVPGLGYRAPADAAAFLEDSLPDRSAFASFLDLGCGTGLVAGAIRDAFRLDTATGVDVSSRMAEVATQKNLYDRLIVGDAVRLMRSLKERFELIAAVELAPYLGNLSGLMEAVHTSLLPQGYFLCSSERTDETSYRLNPSRRFAHGDAYVKEVAGAAGLKLLASRHIPLHRGPRAHAEGTLFLFQHG